MTTRERAVILGAFAALLLFQFAFVYFEVWKNPEVTKKILPTPLVSVTPDQASRGVGAQPTTSAPSSTITPASSPTTRVPLHPMPRSITPSRVTK